MKTLFAAAGIALLFASCSADFEKTKSGLAYKIIKGKGGAKLKGGDIIKINGTIKIAPKDTVLFSTTRMSEYLPVDTGTRLTHDFSEVLKYCSVGDSLITIAQVDTLVKRGTADYKGFFKRGDQLVTGIRIVKAFSSREEVMKDQQQEMDKERARETAEMEKELSKKGIKAEKTESGVFVEMINSGSGEKVQNGKQVTVNYTGSLMENGKKFDSNEDTAFHHTEPYKFVVGTGETIRGWEEGILKLSTGSKANLYIPAMMGYGPQGMPPTIPRFAALKFEIEVLKVEDAPARPKMPMGMNSQQGGNPQEQGGNPQQNPNK